MTNKPPDVVTGIWAKPISGMRVHWFVQEATGLFRVQSRCGLAYAHAPDLDELAECNTLQLTASRCSACRRIRFLDFLRITKGGADD